MQSFIETTQLNCGCFYFLWLMRDHLRQLWTEPSVRNDSSFRVMERFGMNLLCQITVGKLAARYSALQRDQFCFEPESFQAHDREKLDRKDPLS